jgi:hypothetical protein
MLYEPDRFAKEPTMRVVSQSREFAAKQETTEKTETLISQFPLFSSVEIQSEITSSKSANSARPCILPPLPILIRQAIFHSLFLTVIGASTIPPILGQEAPVFPFDP